MCLKNKMPELEKIFIENLVQLRDWLQENYSQKDSVWLVKWKKEFTNTYLSYDDIVDELMCYGWVDSLPKKLDHKRTMLRISPRNPKSNWSKVNKERVDRLIKEDRMQPAGYKLIDIAKANGAWDFLNNIEKLITPPDLEEALKENSLANYYFERFPNSSKRGILEWIITAKQSTTRQKRIQDTVSKAAKNIKANHPKGRDAGPKDDKT